VSKPYFLIESVVDRLFNQTQAIDDVHRAVADDIKDAEAQQEGKEIVAELAKIKYELQHNRQMTYNIQ
jgi:hypothetical protein